MPTQFTQKVSFWTAVVLCALTIGNLSGCAWLKRPMGNQVLQAHEFTTKAEESLARKDYRQAEKLLGQALRADPEHTEVYLKLAELQSAQGKKEAAINSLKLASRNVPDDPQLWFHLARLQYAQKNWEETTHSLNQTLKYDSDHLEALKLRAIVFDHQGKYELALKDCQRVLTLMPEDLRTRIQTADLEIKLHRPERAAPILRNLCKCDQASLSVKLEANWKLGEAYAQVGRWQDAAEMFAQVQQQRPLQNAEEWYRVAYVNYMIQNWAEADQAVQNALTLQSTHQEALILANSLKLVRTGKPAIQQAGSQELQSQIR